jgi:hypothetical protein
MTGKQRGPNGPASHTIDYRKISGTPCGAGHHATAASGAPVVGGDTTSGSAREPSLTTEAWAAIAAPSLTVERWQLAERWVLFGRDPVINPLGREQPAEGFGHTLWDNIERARALLALRDLMAAGAFRRSDGKVNCDACCNGDRCDEPRHVDRRKCSLCRGSGALPEPFAAEVMRAKQEVPRG